MHIKQTSVLALALSLSATVAAGEIDEAVLYMEQNLTDGDMEVVIKLTGGDEGLGALTITAPDGRTLLDARSPGAKLGLRPFKIESPEPAADGSVQADWPAGRYQVVGTSIAGETLTGSVELSHEMPTGATFVQPTAGQEGVKTDGVIKWEGPAEVANYVLILEDEKTDLELEVELPADTTSFQLPPGYLRPGTEYKLAIGAVAGNGNRSFVEIEIETAGEE
jgi:hypothetical protein